MPVKSEILNHVNEECIKAEHDGEEQCSFDSSDWEEVQSTTVVIDSSDYVDYAAIYYNSLQNKATKL